MFRDVLAHPVPRWSAVLHAGAPSSATDEDLARPWRREDERALWLSHAGWSHYLIVRWWERVARRERPCLWLPDYYAYETLPAVLDRVARICFYPIGLDFQPKWDACYALAKDHPPDLFHFVHYFGYVSDAPAPKEFCRQYGAYLIEDATHVMRRIPGVGAHGDFVLFEPRLMLPIPDGALLLLRRDADATLEVLEDVLSELPVAASERMHWFLGRLGERLMPFSLKRRMVSHRSAQFLDPHPVADPDRIMEQFETPRISDASRGMIRYMLSSLEGAAADRRRNDTINRRLLVGEMTPPAHMQGRYAIPFYTAARYPDEDQARRRYEQFVSAGVPVRTWPILAPENDENPRLHADAIRMRRTQLFFPTHQGLGRDYFDHLRAVSKEIGISTGKTFLAAEAA